MSEAFDFRRIDPSAVRVAKTPSRSLYSLAPRIPVQFPRVAVTVTLGNFGYSLLARFKPSAVDSHAKFCEWVDRVEERAILEMEQSDESSACRTWVPSLKGFGDSRSMYLTIGTDAVTFDESKALFEASPTALKFADLLCEIQGVWTKPDQFGLRWRIVQVLEASRGPFENPLPPAFESDDADYESLLKPELDESLFKKRRIEPTMLFVDE